MHRFLASLLPIILLPLMSAPALGCACCAEPGERFAETVNLDDYLLDELKLIKTKGRAYVYLSNCDFECVRGIEQPQYEYDATYAVTQRQIRLTLESQSGPGGSITLSIPETAVDFGVDTKPDYDGYPHYIYKELRLKTPASGTGAFAALTPAADTHLILQGEGNICTSANSFSHWHLSANGKEVEFRFYGRLAPLN